MTRKPVNKWLVTISVTFGTLMGAIDASIINVAVPHLRGSLGTTVEEITWVTVGFVIASVLVMPLTAFFGRFFGQKRVYLTALAVFVFGSLLCGLAWSLTSLIVFRVIQGLGAGALQPSEQAILRQTFPPEEQGMAMAVFGMAVVLGPAFGPTLGGWIVDNYDWPWIFYINLPVGILALFMVTRFVQEPEDIRAANKLIAAKQRRNMDWAGIALMAIGIACAQYVLEEGSKDDWFSSNVITGCTLVAIFALAAFVIRELNAPAPAVDISLFKDPVFVSGTLVGALMFAMLISITFLLPVFMQELLGFTAMQSGLALMPRSLTMMVAMPIVGRLYNRVDPRFTVAFGICLFAVSAWLMSHYTLNTTATDVVGMLVVQGFAFACLFIPLTTVALSKVPRRQLADATGLNSLMRQIGGSLGLAIFASLIPRYTIQAKAALAAHVTAGALATNPVVPAMTKLLATRGIPPGAAQAMVLGRIAGVVARQAVVLAFERVFLLSGIAFLVVMPLVILLRSPTHAKAHAKIEAHLEM